MRLPGGAARIAVPAIVASALALTACLSVLGVGFDPHPDERDGGSSGTPGSADGGSSGGPASTDAGDAAALAVPPDFACNEAWTAPARSDARCLARRSIVVDSLLAFTTAITAVVVDVDNVVLAYNTRQNMDEGELRIRAIKPNAPDAGADAPPTVLQRNFEDVGVAAKLARGGPDPTQTYLAYQELNGGDVVVVQRDATGFVSPPSLVASGFTSSIALDLAASPAGDIAVVIGDRTRRKCLSYVRAAGSTTFAAPVIYSDWGAMETAPNAGDVAVAFDGAGTEYALAHQPLNVASSRLQVVQITPTGGSMARTIDFVTLGGYAGISPSLGLVGAQRVASYFTQTNAAPARADMRVATLASADELPAISVVRQDIPVEATSRLASAAALDRFGLLHIAFIAPSPSGNGALQWLRQYRDASGMRWLVDTIDDFVLTQGATNRAVVAIAVDANRRPHIFYSAERTNTVRYATIY